MERRDLGRISTYCCKAGLSSAFDRILLRLPPEPGVTLQACAQACCTAMMSFGHPYEVKTIGARLLQ